VSALLSDQRALAPLAVHRIDGAPGLAEAVSAGLNREEIAASTVNSGDGFLSLSGKIRSESGSVRLIWQIAAGDGRIITEFRQALHSGSLDPPQLRDTAETAVRSIVHALRGDDSGTADLEAAPHVALRKISTPDSFDGPSLASAMSRALGRQGLAVVADRPDFVIDGRLQIGPTAAGQNLVTVDWTVRRADGGELGVVSQASPVPHERLLGPTTGLMRDIAGAGAEGIAEVIRKSAAPHPSDGLR
jgi:hypothetical protein